MMIIIKTMTNNDHACDNADADHDGWGETCRLGAGRGRRHQLQGERETLISGGNLVQNHLMSDDDYSVTLLGFMANALLSLMN